MLQAQNNIEGTLQFPSPYLNQMMPNGAGNGRLPGPCQRDLRHCETGEQQSPRQGPRQGPCSSQHQRPYLGEQQRNNEPRPRESRPFPSFFGPNRQEEDIGLEDRPTLTEVQVGILTHPSTSEGTSQSRASSGLEQKSLSIPCPAAKANLIGSPPQAFEQSGDLSCPVPNADTTQELANETFQPFQSDRLLVSRLVKARVVDQRGIVLPGRHYSSTRKLQYPGFLHETIRIPSGLSAEQILRHYPNHITDAVLKVCVRNGITSRTLYRLLPEKCKDFDRANFDQKERPPKELQDNSTSEVCQIDFQPHSKYKKRLMKVQRIMKIEEQIMKRPRGQQIQRPLQSQLSAGKREAPAITKDLRDPLKTVRPSEEYPGVQQPWQGRQSSDTPNRSQLPRPRNKRGRPVFQSDDGKTSVDEQNKAVKRPRTLSASKVQGQTQGVQTKYPKDPEHGLLTTGGNGIRDRVQPPAVQRLSAVIDLTGQDEDHQEPSLAKGPSKTIKTDGNNEALVPCTSQEAASSVPQDSRTVESKLQKTPTAAHDDRTSSPRKRKAEASPHTAKKPRIENTPVHEKAAQIFDNYRQMNHDQYFQLTKHDWLAENKDQPDVCTEWDTFYNSWLWRNDPDSEIESAKHWKYSAKELRTRKRRQNRKKAMESQKAAREQPVLEVLDRNGHARRPGLYSPEDDDCSEHFASGLDDGVDVSKDPVDKEMEKMTKMIEAEMDRS